MAEPTLFNAFMDLLKELGIDPQPTDRDPYGTSGTRRVMMALEKVKDFPVERLPELKEYAEDTEVLNPDALIKKMRAMIAQGPKHSDVGALIDKHNERRRESVVPALEHVQAVDEDDPKERCWGATPAEAKLQHKTLGCPRATHCIFINPFATSEQREWAAKRVKPPRRELWAESNQNTGAA